MRELDVRGRMEPLLTAAEETLFFFLHLVFAVAVLALGALVLSVLFWLLSLLFS